MLVGTEIWSPPFVTGHASPSTGIRRIKSGLFIVMHLMKHQIRVPAKIACLWCQLAVIPTSLGCGLGSKGLASRGHENMAPPLIPHGLGVLFAAPLSITFRRILNWVR